MNDALVHRSVDGWDLCSRDGAAWWIRDLELAERAGLAKPRDIKTTIDGMIGDRALAEFQVVRDAGNLNSAGISDAALYIADTVLVPMPRARGHKEVTEYLLNRKASVLVLARLRTSKALSLIDTVVSVFLRVVDGGLAGEELRALREERAANGAELALVKSQLVKLSHQMVDVENAMLLGAGVTSIRQRGQVKSAKRRAAKLQVEAGLASNLRSALRSLQNGVMVTGWGGRGQRDELLPVDLFTRVLAFFEGEANTAARILKRRAQPGLPGLHVVAPIVGRKKF